MGTAFVKRSQLLFVVNMLKNVSRNTSTICHHEDNLWRGQVVNRTRSYFNLPFSVITLSNTT